MDYTDPTNNASLNFSNDEDKKRNYKNIFVPTKCLKVTNVPSGKSGNDVASFFAQKGIGVRMEHVFRLVAYNTLSMFYKSHRESRA